MYKRMSSEGHPAIKDYGPDPFVFNIAHATTMNQNFRTTLWTGKDLQLTVMSIPAGGEVGEELHDNVDQFFRVESGRAKVVLGEKRDAPAKEVLVDAGYAIVIPRGTWHNIINAGNRPLKLYSLYAPPQHPKGTVHGTKADSDKAEGGEK